MARRNARQNGRKSKTPQGPSRELAPYSMVEIPPKAPPVVAMNPKRKIVVDIDTVTVANVFALTAAVVRGALVAQAGLSASTLHYVVERIHVWGAQDPILLTEVTLVENTFGTTSNGDSTVTDRPRAGIMFPKNVQPHVAPSATTQLAVVTTSGPTDKLTFRVGVVYWA